MEQFKLFKKEYVIGLDIGTSSVKMAQFIEKEDGLHLLRADMKEMKQADDAASFEKEALSALKFLLRDVNIGKSKIGVAINDRSTAIKKVIAPYMPKTELREGIKLEAKNYFHFPIDESLIDFEIVRDVMEKGIRKYEIIVAASPHKTVRSYLNLLTKIGLKPDSLVPSPYALKKFSDILYPAAGEADNAKCYIDIGHSYTELIICKGNSLVFGRKIPIAGNDFTKALTGVLVSDRGKTQLTMEEAEAIKETVGIPADGESKSINDKIASSQIMSMLRAPLEQLSSEFNRCFDYYREESAGGRVESLVLFGGGASLRGLTQFLSRELDIDVRLGDSLSDLRIEQSAVRERDKISHRLELAVGAALVKGKGINILPPEVKDETKRMVRRGTIEVLATAVILASALFYIGLKIQLDNLEKRTSAAKLELASTEPQFRRAEAQILASKVLTNEPFWEDIFKELSNIVPYDIYLTRMTMEGNTITMNGIITAEKGQETLTDFILGLEKRIFSNVKLVRSKELESNAGFEFELRCWVDYEKPETRGGPEQSRAKYRNKNNYEDR